MVSMQLPKKKHKKLTRTKKTKIKKGKKKTACELKFARTCSGRFSSTGNNENENNCCTVWVAHVGKSISNSLVSHSIWLDNFALYCNVLYLLYFMAWYSLHCIVLRIIWYDMIWYDIISSHPMSCYPMSCPSMSCHSMSCYISCHAMYHATPYIMPCHAMSCHVMSYQIRPYILS